MNSKYLTPLAETEIIFVEQILCDSMVGSLEDTTDVLIYPQEG